MSDPGKWYTFYSHFGYIFVFLSTCGILCDRTFRLTGRGVQKKRLSSAASHRNAARGQSRDTGIRNQPYEARRLDRLRHLQGPLACRFVFKALNRNLNINAFADIPPSAVKTQIWTARIAKLQLRFLQPPSRFGLSLLLAASLRMNPFIHRDFRVRLDEPFAIPQVPSQSPNRIPHLEYRLFWGQR